MNPSPHKYKYRMNLRSFIFLSLGLLASFPSLAQDEILIDSIRNVLKKEIEIDTSWKKKVEFGANLNQGSFSSN